MAPPRAAAGSAARGLLERGGAARARRPHRRPRARRARHDRVALPSSRSRIGGSTAAIRSRRLPPCDRRRGGAALPAEGRRVGIAADGGLPDGEARFGPRLCALLGLWLAHAARSDGGGASALLGGTAVVQPVVRPRGLRVLDAVGTARRLRRQGAARGNAESYIESGWCFVEACTGSAQGRHALPRPRKADEGRACYGGGWVPEAKLESVCAAAREAPLLPKDLHALVTTKKFAGRGDVDIVSRLYSRFFEGAPAVERLDFSGLAWGAWDLTPRPRCRALAR